MGDLGGSPVPGAEGTTEGLAPPAILDPMILRFAVLTYLVVLPVGHLVAIPVNGMMARGTDVFLALVLLAAIVDIGRMIGPYLTREGGGPFLPGRRASYIAALFIAGFSAWAALGATWSLYPAYALTKGLAFAALGMGALAILWCGAPWEEAADAWLLGTLICLVVTWIGVLVGPDALQTRLLYEGGSVRGLPLPRVSGPFPHPNMFGEFLVVSGAILWTRWEAARERWGPGAVAAAWLLAGTLVMTVSSAWLGAGVLLTAMGLLTMRQRDGDLSLQLHRPVPIIFVVTGVVLFTMTLAGLLVPMGVDVAGLSISGSGIRPTIWVSALETFKEAPIGGVGASPFSAVAADPLSSTSFAASWDAHNVYLSILGQFGVVGAALFAGALVVIIRTLVQAGTSRRHAVLVVALLAVAVHGVTVANEEFRHLWALLGLVGLAGVPQWTQGQWWREEGSQE